MAKRSSKGIIAFLLVGIFTVSTILILSTVSRIGGNLKYSSQNTTAVVEEIDENSQPVSVELKTEEKSSVPAFVSILAFFAMIILVAATGLLLYKKKVESPEKVVSESRGYNPKSEVTFRSLCFNSKYK